MGVGDRDFHSKFSVWHSYWHSDGVLEVLSRGIYIGVDIDPRVSDYVSAPLFFVFIL